MGSPPPFGIIAVVVCDSVGCGNAPDAADFGDEGANTLAHVVEQTGVQLPHLAALGAESIPGVPRLGGGAHSDMPAACGRMFSRSPAKDTMVGHWELMGVVADQAFPTYPDGFPAEIIDEFERRIGTRTLGNKSASGTDILDELGEEHLRTGAPIIYTSGDSVFQIAAHVDRVGLEELYAMSTQARELLTGVHGVGRVIARPFSGPAAGQFERLATGRRDYALPPVRPTTLDHLVGAGVATHGIGKINDIFVGRGLTSYEKTAGNGAGIDATCQALADRTAPLVFTNLVDFDSLYGHRNNVAGYAKALEQFDAALPRMIAQLPEDGLLLITADHGNDPTWPGTDHTREAVPLIAVGPRVEAVNLGTRASFADLGTTIADNFAVAGRLEGSSFLAEIAALS
jgi:phosphopentomutase